MLRTPARYALIAVIQLAVILPSVCFVNSPLSPTSHASLPRVSYNPARGYLAASPSQAPRLTQRRQQCAAVYPAPCHPTQRQPSNDRSVRSTSSRGLSALSLPRSKPDQQPFLNGRFAAICASALALYFAVTVLGSAPVAATATETVAAAAEVGGKEHLHIGQKIAELFRRSGLPDWATLMTISAMPVVELRGGVPVGIWMGLPIAQVFVLCVVGNMIPIPAILLALKSPLIQKIAKPVLSRARKKAEELGDAQSQSLALTLFVGIPLPGTGAWTGAMGASLLGMPFQKVIRAFLDNIT